LFVGVGVPALLVALAGVWLSWHRATAAIHGATQREAATLAEMIAGNFNLATPGKTAREAHRAVREAVHSDSLLLRDVDGLRVLGPDGKVLWSRRVEDEGGLPSPASAGSLHGARIVRQLGGMECAACHADHAMNLGTLTLSIDAPTLRRQASGVFQISLFSLAALGAVLALATALSLHFMLTRPLRRLAGMMRRAEEGDFLVRAPVSGDDELSQLSVAFNRMLERLTSMKAAEIDTHRDLELAHEQLSLKKALEETNDQLQTRLNALSLLFDVAKSLNATLEPQELFNRVSALITERMKIPRFSIMMVAPNGQLEVAISVPRGTEGLTFEIGEGACGYAAGTVKAVYIPDTSQSEIFVARGTRPRGGALLSIPMIHKERLLGVLNFERAEIASFDAGEIELFTAVTDQVAMAVQNAKLHHETVELSITDALTGLPNRRHLFARLELEVARAQRFGTGLSMLMVDIDHFKKLNDNAGHRAGDKTLREVSERMRVLIRKVDTLGRYGGEEFALVLPQVSKAEALEVAEKLRQAVAENEFTHGPSQPGAKVTISVGVATLPEDADSLERLVDCADSALYASKRGGRNLVSGYSPGMEDHPGRERGLSPLKRAKTGEHPLTKQA